jgi:alpha-glucosidase (family GH31 glycosyl hydrolase)
MYDETTSLIRDAIKRRYELMPYMYSLMLESHMTALPPQRWTGHGYESDPEVWTPKVMSGETQYWLGDTLLFGSVYKSGETAAKLYLPKADGDDGFINPNELYNHIKPGQWVEIKSEWRKSIPLLAKIGGALLVGENLQTRAPGDHTHFLPNIVEDDYRVIEIFPPRGESKTYSVVWFEDDGIAAKPDISSFIIRYSSRTIEVSVEVEIGKEDKYAPILKDIDIILPVGDQRPVASRRGALPRVEDRRDRAVFRKSFN